MSQATKWQVDQGVSTVTLTCPLFQLSPQPLPCSALHTAQVPAQVCQARAAPIPNPLSTWLVFSFSSSFLSSLSGSLSRRRWPAGSAPLATGESSPFQDLPPCRMTGKV